MGNISELPDDLLAKILSFLPTKYIVSTSLISKRWRYLWTNVSRLTLNAPRYDGDNTRLSRLFKGYMLSHQPHTLETLCLDVRQCSWRMEIKPKWIRTDVICNLRKLEVVAGFCGHIKLPSALFTCEKLVSLKLRGRVIVNVLPTVCLPSLETLHCDHFKLLKDESIVKILSSSPLLSDLRLDHHVMSKLNILMPSLQRLTIVPKVASKLSSILFDDYIRSLDINTPSLEYLHFEDMASRPYVWVEIRSPLNFEDTSIYGRIARLELNMYNRGVSEELLIHLLERSINLSVLEINNRFTPRDSWKPPSSVPTCLLWSLETLVWRRYAGTCAEKELLSYLLKHALCLETAEIITESCGLFEKQPMMDDLLSMPRGSTTCMLVLE